MVAWVPVSGLLVAERYRLVSPLGQGGMGSVWRAEHEGLRSAVAVKLLNPSIADNPEMLERFMREAQSSAALRSTHVVQVFDYGVHAGMPFIAMELLSGESLGVRLQRGCLAPSELAWVYTHVSRAIQRAHELGIVHRDLKPDNLFLVHDGDVTVAKVLDFGIAKVMDATALSQSSGNTRTGAVLGTPYYMSPEQARGNRDVDFRSDLWAMGVIAFEALTGCLPFSSSALGDLVLKICTQPTPKASSIFRVPVGFDDWFARACHKEPSSRFASMREQCEALQSVLGHGAFPDVGAPRRASGLGIDLGDFQTLSSEPPPNTVSVAPRHTTNSTPIAMVATRQRRALRPAFVAAGVATALLVGWGAMRTLPVKPEPDDARGAATALHTELIATPTVGEATRAVEVPPGVFTPGAPTGAPSTPSMMPASSTGAASASATTGAPATAPPRLALKRQGERSSASRPNTSAVPALAPTQHESTPTVNRPSPPNLFDDRK